MSSSSLVLHEFHRRLGARFGSLNGQEIIADYGDPLSEHQALVESAGVLDLGFRSRVCLTGEDRVRFLHGQVTNDVNGLKTGEGCYAALITAKGKMQSDLNIYRLPDELLLDFEPGLTQTVSERLEQYVISEDVQVLDVQQLYGLLSVQGPKAKTIVQGLGLFGDLPAKPLAFVQSGSTRAEIYLMNQSRFGTCGYDLFVPVAEVAVLAERLIAAAQAVGGKICGWTASELARIEAGIPRFGEDMDETNIPLETGIEARGISTTKGCYIGQEVISRIRTYSEAARALRGFRLADNLKDLPSKGDKLFHQGKEVGYITSAVASPTIKANIALGYVRKEVNQVGTELRLRSGETESVVRIVELPFMPGA